MNFEISKETIIVCENIYKKRILDKLNNISNLYPIHFMTKNEFNKKYSIFLRICEKRI